MLLRDQIKAAYIEACHGEIAALKPGNVHRFADGHRMVAQQFIESAEISAGPLCNFGDSVGQRVLNAVAATRTKIGTNTNLGIILLCAPLAKAAEDDDAPLDTRLSLVLEMMDQADARDVFDAITLANPGGLGSSEKHDVSKAPSVPLREAMQEAADRDMIAKQYATDFKDIFSGGLSTYAEALNRREQGMWPTVFVYMYFLTSFPDSHIGRKQGTDIAEQTRMEAVQILQTLADTNDATTREMLLMDFDIRLKARGINPGTSADLTVATLFAARLNFILHNNNVNA
ncbi:MAG: triphosphoribosyl-dephospho-CoA synthase [Phyllobacterium sp.]